MPLDGRPRDADDRHAAGPLPLRRHSLVLDHVRPRRDHHRAADAVVRSRASPRACCGGSPPIRPTTFDPLADAEPGKILHEMRGGEMAALREVPFGLYYGSVDATPLFVMLAGLYVEHTGDIETLRELWPNIEAALAWIDGPGDPDRDGFVEYHRADETGPGQPGLEGFPRRDLPCRRLDWRRGRSRSARCRATSMRPSGWPRAARAGSASIALGRRARCAGGKARRAIRGGVLVRGHRHLCARARRRRSGRAACGPRMPARCCSAASPRRSAPNAVMRDLMRPSFFSGWGIRTRGPRGAALQSDVVSQRLGLAARQCADRGRALRATATRARSIACSRACSTPRPTWICGGCRNCIAASSAAASAGRRSIRSPARRRPGPRARRFCSCSPRSASSSIRTATKSCCASRGCRRSSRRSRCATCGSGARRVDLMLRRHGDDVSLQVLAQRGADQGRRLVHLMRTVIHGPAASSAPTIVRRRSRWTAACPGRG